MALTIMCLERNYRVPDGLLLAYPALNLDKNSFTPSLMIGIDDPLLPYPYLKMCLDSYVGSSKEEAKFNPYLSPIKVSDSILSQFPSVRIQIANNDPLRDESFNLTLRLAKLGKDVKLKEYMYMPHGFLGFNAPLLGMKDECDEAIKDGANWMREMIQKA